MFLLFFFLFPIQIFDWSNHLQFGKTFSFWIWRIQLFKKFEYIWSCQPSKFSYLNIIKSIYGLIIIIIIVIITIIIWSLIFHIWYFIFGEFNYSKSFPIWNCQPSKFSYLNNFKSIIWSLISSIWYFIFGEFNYSKSFPIWNCQPPSFHILTFHVSCTTSFILFFSREHVSERFFQFWGMSLHVDECQPRGVSSGQIRDLNSRALVRLAWSR